MVPMSATFLVYGIIKSNSDTFFIEQANSMNREFGFVIEKIPIVLFIVLAGLTGSAAKFLYKILLEKRIEQRDRKLYSDAVKIGIGLSAGLFCCAFAMWVESKRLKALKKNYVLNKPEDIAPLSVFWIAPQYVLIGIMDGLAGDGMVDFYKHQVPPSTKRYGVVFANFFIGCGKILNAVIILMLGMKGIWFADTVIGGHLDRFYRALVVLSLVNLFVYAIAANFHAYQKFPKDEEAKGMPHEEIATAEETPAVEAINNLFGYDLAEVSCLSSDAIAEESCSQTEFLFPKSEDSEMPHEGIANAEETPAVQAIHNRVEEEDQAHEVSRNVARSA